MKFFKQTVALAFAMFLLAGSVLAQGQQMPQMKNAKADSISDNELKKFVATTGELQTIQQSTQKEVEKMVEKEGMEFPRFQKIMMSKQNPQMAKNVEVTSNEEKTIKKLQPELTKANQEAQQKFVKAIQDEGLTPQRFQQIAQAVQTNPEVAKRYQQMAGGTSGANDG